jgi:diguanylate cyclase (GGDEF)-like protein
MRAAFFRILLAVAAAMAGIALLLYGDRALQEYFRKNLKVRNRFQSLQTALYALEGEVLRNGAYLYYNYDRINKLLDRIETLLTSLREDREIRSSYHRKSLRMLEELSRKFRNYVRKVQGYLTINASLKNSFIYIPTLQLRAFRIFDPTREEDRDVLLLLSKINASIFLARNAQDIDFLDEIKNYRTTLDDLIARFDGPKRKLLRTLEQHLQLFIDYFPASIQYFHSLMTNDLIRETERISSNFREEAGAELRAINQNTRILLALYLLSLAVVIYFILRTHRENRYLRKLRNELETHLVTDTLTGLGNRLAYRKRKSRMNRPALILANIDRFKHINDFYGSSIGDGVLKEVGTLLKEITPPELNATLYRMGGDDFGILFERENSSMEMISLLRNYQEKLRDCSVKVEDLTIDLSFALGGSEKSDWLFETADMALKAAKSSQRKRYALYHRELDNREEIARNIQALRRIRSALVERRVIPYFQPIRETEQGHIRRFEALARIELDEGRHTLQPYSFIHAANEAKLSGEITLNILESTLEMARRYPFEFSVNISAGDISNREDRDGIVDLLERHRDLAPRIILEILESEEIRDYELTAEFITTVKRLGCRIAIDDFGSGYSNFEKILLLDIDILKVDGSLIRRIDRDRHSELIVRTILDFARHAGWETVAEYVHSRPVYEKVKTMGFDYVQGYYIGKPSRELQRHFKENGTEGSLPPPD